jgi:DNA-directed RNA polymerase specialized sigma24 family protein
VRRYETPARRLAYVICGSSLDADEAAQDAMVNGYRAIGRFRSDAPFRVWLFRIVANEARNQRPRAVRRARARRSRVARRRLRGPTLRRGVAGLGAVRLESALDRGRMIELADSMRPLG